MTRRGALFSGAAGPVLVYRNEVIADAPRVYYELSDASGNFVDQRGILDAVASGVWTYNEPGLVKAGTCVKTADTTARGYFATEGSSLNTVTFECWFKPSAVGTAGSIMEAGATSKGVLLGIDASGYIHFHTTSGTDRDLVAASPLSANERVHLVGVSEINVGCKLYINGSLAASFSDGAFPDATGSNVGTFGDQNGSVVSTYAGAAVGWYDEVAIYHTALSAARVSAHYAAGI